VLPLPIQASLPSNGAARRAAAVLEAIREAVGEQVDVMVDLHGRTSEAGAIEVGRALEPLRPWFLEEPVGPGQVRALPRIAAAVAIPLATGERMVGRREFLPVLEAGGVAVLQPDVCHCGGLSELRRIAALAETFGVGLAPHNPLGPVATAHNLHIAASTPNWLIQEQMLNAAPWVDEIVTAPLEIVGGYAQLPTGPGLGLEVDEQAAARYPYEPESQVRATLRDGSVADW
jgi:galactonate dehydratase